MQSAQQLVVGYDGSILSELAVRHALRMVAGSLVANLHVVCVAEEEEGEMVRLPSGELMTRFAALQTLQHIVGRLGSDDAEGNSSAGLYVHLRTGEVASTIVDIAYRFHAELILLGVGGQGGSAKIGPVAAEVLELSEIPVELETALSCSVETDTFNPLRFAYVFGSYARKSADGSPSKEL